MTRAESVKALENLGYVVNLWHTSDVTDNYKCSDSMAATILDEVFDKSEEDIFERISEEAFDRGLDLHE